MKSIQTWFVFCSNKSFGTLIDWWFNMINLLTDWFIARKDKNVRRYKSDKERLEVEVEELEKKVERMGKMGTQVKHKKNKTYRKMDSATQVELPCQTKFSQMILWFTVDGCDMN